MTPHGAAGSEREADAPWLRAMVESSLDLVAVQRADHTLSYVSPSVERLLGYRPEELIGAVVTDYIHPDDLQKAGERFYEALRAPGVNEPLIVRYRHRDGSWRHFETICNSLLDDPAVEGLIFNCRDVTAQVEAEQEILRLNRELEGQVAERTLRLEKAVGELRVNESRLERSEQRYRRVVEQAADAMFVHDLDGRLEDVNRQACESLGYSREELLALSVADVEMGFTRESMAHLWAMMRLDQPLTLEGVHRRKDGTTFPVEVRVGAFESEGRSLVLALARDTSERKRDEEALRYSQSSLAEAQRIAGIGNWDYDVARDEAYWSDELYRIFGFEPREFVPGYGSFLKLVHPGDRRLLREAVRHAAAGDDRASVEYRIVRPDGGTRLVRTEYESVRDDSGRMIRLIGTIQDITERERTEAELQQSEERYRIVAETASDAIVVIGEDGRMSFVNSAAEETFGYSQQEMVGEPIAMLMPERLRAWHRAAFERYLGTGERRLNWRSINLPGLHRSGREIPLEMSFGEFVRNGRRFFTGFIRDLTESERAREALKESEVRFRATFDQAAVGVAHLDFEGNWLRVNQKLCDILGYTREEMLQRAFQELTHPEDLPANEELFERFVAGELETYSIEKRYLGKDGSIPWVRVTVSAARDETGQPEYQIAIVEDITERKRTQEDLRRSEERYRAVIEQMAEGIFFFEADTKRIVESNTAFERMFGYTAEEAGRLTLYDLVAHDPESVDNNVRRNLDEGHVYVGERKYRRKDGSLRDVEVSGSVISYVGGKEVVCAVVRDVTERRQAEEALRQSERLYRTVVEQAAENIFLVDEESGRILESNAALQDSLGYAAEELGSLTLYDLVAHDPESIDSNIRRVHEQGSYFIGERRYRCKDGSLIEVEVRVSEILREGRRTLCVVAHDTAERKRDEEAVFEVRQAERSRIARELHDDVLQDLIYALQEAQILEELSEGEYAMGEVTGALRRAVEGIRAAVFELRLEETLKESFVASLRAMVDLHRRMARKAHKIEMKVEDELPLQLSREAARGLIRIVQEALSNARRHSAARVVQVSLAVEEERVRLEVSDDGRGFETGSVEPGVGTRSMWQRAREIGGELEVESAPGSGTRVRFSAPAASLREI